MKRIAALLLLSCFLTALLPAPAAAATPRVLLNGKQLTFDVPPVILAGRVLVPLRAIFESLGAKVTYDPASRGITGERDERKVRLTVDSADATVNDTPIKLSVPAQVIAGRTLVPLRFVAEALDAQVEWNGDTRTVTITAEPKEYWLEIPRLGVKSRVIEGLDDELLKDGPGHYPGTPFPGEKGNAALAGHRTYRTVPHVFYRLNELQAGDTIIVTYPKTGLRYVFAVDMSFLTHAYDLTVVAPTEHATLTLTTCDPPGRDDNRLVVRARLKSVERI